MTDEQARQAALDGMGILDTPPDERVDRVVRLAQAIFDVPMVHVSLIDHERQWVKSHVGLGVTEFPRKDSFCDHTVRQDRAIIVGDTRESEVFAQNPYVLGDPHLRFYAGHPLRAQGGEPVGTLCLLDTQPRDFTESQKALLRELALWVQIQLDRAQEIDHAATIQRSIMCPERHPSVPGYTIATAAVAQEQLSGDFYSLTMHEGILRLSLADAMGHGIGAALVAAGVRASLATAPGRSLSQAIAEADRLVEKDVGDTGMFVTAVHAAITPDTGRVELVDAGHGLAFIVCGDGAWTPLRSIGLPLGMGGGTVEEREPVVVHLEPGDSFVCSSDGLLDVLDPADPYGQVERAIRRFGPTQAVREAVRLAQHDNATDDITVMIIRRDR